MDDELPGGVWRLDPDLGQGLRLQRVRKSLEAGELEAAVQEAEELLDEAPQHPDALFLLGEALLELGDYELAMTTFQQRVALDGGDVDSLLGLGIAAFQTCDLQLSIETTREVIRLEPELAEAHYYLGLARERVSGQSRASLTELMAAYQLSPKRFPLPRDLSHADWQDLVAGAVARLPEKLHAFYSNLPFTIEDLPELDELRAHDPPLPPTIAALHTGEPTEGKDAWEHRPESIRLFARNLARAPTPDELIDVLRQALLDEAGHWLGISPEEL
ncbi:MAG: tetratricopeptide repeat protein [Myxococcota bacterium]